MTRLDKWKRDKIKAIEKTTLEDAAQNIIRHNGCPLDGYCPDDCNHPGEELDCKKCIMNWLSETEEESNEK